MRPPNGEIRVVERPAYLSDIWDHRPVLWGYTKVQPGSVFLFSFWKKDALALLLAPNI